MRYLSAALVLLSLSACEPGAAKIDENPQLNALQEQLHELADELGAAQAQIDALQRDQAAEDVCVPLPKEVIGHPGNRNVLFGGVCASAVNIITLTQDEEPFASYDMSRVGDDLWLGFVHVGSGWYRLMATLPDGSVRCFPGPDCDSGHLNANEQPE